MASYRVEVKRSAQKEIRKLPVTTRKRVVTKIRRLSADPLPAGTEKIKGADNAYRLRQGNYRIAYALFKQKLTVIIVRVGHRKEAYRNL